MGFAQQAPRSGPPARVQVKVRLSARPEGLADLHSTFDQFFEQAQAAGMPVLGADRLAILTAAGELVANIVEHACAELTNPVMSLVLERSPGRIEIASEDPGVPYVGREVSEDQPVESGLIALGGRGMMVIRASVDELRYKRVGARNRWRLIRNTV
jgi:anti-sigma regulatory factor (Ser/Thr protein kinase)